MVMRWLRLLWLLVLPGSLYAQGIEGQRFEPGEQVLDRMIPANCPEGEMVPGWGVFRGGYECARFQGRTWIRPFQEGTVVYRRFACPIPEAFSLEFEVMMGSPPNLGHDWVVYGCPYVSFQVHDPEGMARLERGEDALAYAYHSLISGHLAACGERSGFGSREQSGRGYADDFRFPLQWDRPHHIALMVRDGRIRFFVDGRLVGMKPFRPQTIPAGISFYFYKHYEGRAPYAEAPPLIRNFRVAAYAPRPSIPSPSAVHISDSTIDILTRAPAAHISDSTISILEAADIRNSTISILAADIENSTISILTRELGGQVVPEGYQVSWRGDTLFESDGGTLRAEGKALLAKLARLAGAGTIRITGAPSGATGKVAEMIAALRAHVVALELIRQGVDPSRVVVQPAH